MMAWILDRVLPGLTNTVILGTVAYTKLYFEKKWPYWGRTRKPVAKEVPTDETHV